MVCHCGKDNYVCASCKIDQLHAENVLLREMILTNGFYCDRHSAEGCECDGSVEEKRAAFLNATPQTAKVQAVLDALDKGIVLIGDGSYRIRLTDQEKVIAAFRELRGEE